MGILYVLKLLIFRNNPKNSKLTRFFFFFFKVQTSDADLFGSMDPDPDPELYNEGKSREKFLGLFRRKLHFSSLNLKKKMFWNQFGGLLTWSPHWSNFVDLDPYTSNADPHHWFQEMQKKVMLLRTQDQKSVLSFSHNFCYRKILNRGVILAKPK